MNGGDLVVSGLIAHGVDTVFGIPGTHNLEIYRALYGSGIRHVTPRHEQGAGYAADGYARSTGRPGVAVVTSGPALLNIATAVGQAYSDSVPLLVIAPGMPLGHRTGTGLLHETKDQTAALAAVAGRAVRVTSHAEIVTAIAAAFAGFTVERPRPVVVEIPLDLLTAEVVSPDESEISGEVIGGSGPEAAPVDQESVDHAARMLTAAARPVMIVGGGAKHAAAEVRALAEGLRAAVLTTTNGKGILPEDHPLAVTSALHLPAVADLLDAADAVLAVGTDLAPTDFWSGLPDLAGKLVRVDIDPHQILLNAAPTVAIVADSATALAALHRAVDPPAADGTSDRRAGDANGDRSRRAATADLPDRDVTTDPPAEEVTTDSLARDVTADPPARDVAGHRPATDASGDRSARDVTADLLARDVAGHRPARDASGDRSARDVTADLLARDVAGHRPARDASGDRSARDVATDPLARDVATDLLAKDDSARDLVHAQAAVEGARWTPWLVAIDAVLVGHDAIVAADNAMGCYYGALGNLPIRRPGGFLFPTGFGTLGFSVPAGIGAKVGNPYARVVALSGDGGLMFSVAEFATAAAERVTLPVVVFDNGGYGEIRAEMRDGGIAPLAVDLPGPDFVALATALGGHGERVTTPDELRSALERALERTGPTLIVVPEGS